MGHKRQRKTLDLRFEDEPGLEILARSVSLGKFLGLMQMADRWASGSLTEAEVTEVAGWFAERIISWNIVDDDDHPVPVTAQYLIDEDIDWVIKVVACWVAGIVQVLKGPLERLGFDPSAMGGLSGLMKLAEQAQVQPDGTTADAEVEASIPMQPVTPE